ncbi:MAG: low-specificity L-threonine aldolase [Phycisphaerae bacterium]|nr:low-specificity L-threonine aldolase [Phycisphaerae bacterium]
MIDLRSDTVTKPGDAMRQAMANAIVGDDILEHDPTVEKLETAVAQLLGKEAALFMPSGIMTNQIALRCHTQPGDEIILDSQAHIYYYEAGGPAALSGVSCNLIDGDRMRFTAEQVKTVLRPVNQHFAPTKLICIENTTNRGGGAIWPLEQIKEVHDLARENNIAMHLDGARLWNATAETGISEKDYSQYFDTISVCFSKGLGAPVGSVLAGPEAIMEKAHRFRRMFGGAMRQSGIIAAGALFALENNRDRLKQDHANAKKLADGIANLPGVKVEIQSVQTNILCFDVTTMPATEMVKKLKAHNIAMLNIGPQTVRAVTNLGVTENDIETTIKVFMEILN